jgi:flagellar biosynthesis/type III secretory pathway protein FliH
MPDEFVTLSVFLRAPAQEPAASVEPHGASTPATCPVELTEAMRAARRFRAALTDALEVALARLLEAISREVLARELAIAPADVVAIVQRVLGELEPEKALAVRAHPEDVASIRALEIASTPDASLRRGDVVVELRSGTIDMRVEARLENVLAACVL